MTWWHIYMMTLWHYDRMTWWWHDDMMIWWHNDRKLCRRFTVWYIIYYISIVYHRILYLSKLNLNIMCQTFSPVKILPFPYGKDRTLQLCQKLKIFQHVKAKAFILYLCVPTSKRKKLKTIRKYVFILSSCVLSQSMNFNMWINILMMRITYRYYTEHELSSGWIIYYMIFIYLSKWNIHGHLRLY